MATSENQIKFFSAGTRYLLAVVAAVLVSVIKISVPELGEGTPTLLYQLAIAGTAVAAGTGPAVVNLVLSTLLIPFLFIGPPGRIPWGWSTAIMVAVYFINGLLLIWMIARLHKAQGQLHRRNAELIESNNRMTSLLSKVLDSTFSRVRVRDEGPMIRE